MTEIDRLQQAMLDGLKAKAAAEFWEDAHDRVEDRMLELEAEVDSLRRRLHELGEEADAQWEIIHKFEYPTEVMVDAADRCLHPPGQHRLGVAAALHAAMQAAKQEVTNDRSFAYLPSAREMSMLGLAAMIQEKIEADIQQFRATRPSDSGCRRSGGAGGRQ